MDIKSQNKDNTDTEIVIYINSKIPNCPFCDAAKKLLDTKGFKYTEIDLVKNQEEFSKSTNNARTVPQIIINGQLIGGYDMLKKMSDDGKI